MPIISLDHVNIRVPAAQLAAVRHFYLDVIGLSEGFRPPFGRPGHWMYAGTQPVIHLSIEREGEGRPIPGGAVDHIAFACTELEATLSRLDDMGVPYRNAEVPLLQLHQVFVRDPSGNGVELNFPLG